MTTYADNKETERKALKKLMPLLDVRSDGAWVPTEKGPLARFLQHTVGDALTSIYQGEGQEPMLVAVEIKGVEAAYDPKGVNGYGSLFLEVWSNRNLEDEASFYERGMKPGWMQTLRTDVLLYLYLQSDDLVIIPWLKLLRWFWCDSNLNLTTALRPQRKTDQLNETLGCLVPVKTLKRVAGAQVVKRQKYIDEMKQENRHG